MNILDFFLDCIRSLCIFVVTGFMAFFQPIQDFLIVIAILFFFNYILGWGADMLKKKDWSLKKSLDAIWQLVAFFLLLFLSFGVGRKMHIDEKALIDFASWLTWVIIYFYATNILRNWKNIQPKNDVVSLIYWVVTVQFVKNIKYLNEFFNTNSDEKNDTE